MPAHLPMIPQALLPTDLQHRALLKVVGTGTALQGGKGNVAPVQGGDVAELRGAEGHPLILTRPQGVTLRTAIGFLAGGTVVLVGLPGSTGACALVDGKALGPTGVEPQSHVGDLVGLPCSQADADPLIEGNGYTALE